MKWAPALLITTVLALASGSTLVGVPSAVGAEIVINQGAHLFEKELESSLYEKVRSIFGTQIQFALSVHIKAKPEPKVVEKIVPEKNKAAEMALDLGYYPGPLSIDTEPRESKAAPEAPKLIVEKVEVDIQIGSEVDDAVVSSIKGTVEIAMKGLEPVINVARVQLPKKEAPPEAPAVDRSTWLLAGAAIITALLLLFGLFLISQAFRSSGKAVADGIRETKNMQSVAAPAPMAIAAAPVQAQAERNAPRSVEVKSSSSDRAASREHDKNLKVLKLALSDDPLLFFRVFGGTNGDWSGLKWILPSLTPEERLTVSQFLGPSKINALSQHTPLTSEENAAPSTWLQDFAERLSLARMRGDSGLDSILSKDQLKSLLSANTDALLSAAQNLNSAGSWRILAELLPRERFQKFLGELDNERWIDLANATAAGSEEIVAAAAELLSYISQAEGQIKASEEKLRFYSENLIEPMIDSFMRKPLGADDAILGQMLRTSPDLVRMVHEKYWTPKFLKRVPSSFLEKLIRGMNQEQRVALLVALPPAEALLIENAIPAGTMRTVAVDTAKNAKSRSDRAETLSQTAIGRQFLDYLRTQCREGRFELEPDRGDDPVAAPLKAVPTGGAEDQGGIAA